MRKSEKFISSQISDSTKSESFNISMLANLSIESIMTDQENAEIDITYSKAGCEALKRNQSKRSENAKFRMQSLKRKEKPRILNCRTLLCIIYCALNICCSDIQLSDLLRLTREGHLSLYNYKQFLPEDIVEQDIPLSSHESRTLKIIWYENLREHLSYFVRFIPDLKPSLQIPNIFELCRRYLNEMNLPTDLFVYIERLMIFWPPEFASNGTVLPNYEGRVMAYILFVLKLLFGIDGYREVEMSDAARDINKALKASGLQRLIFVYEDWRRFIEYRKVILEKFYFPSIYHRDYGSDTAYSAFNSMLAALDPKSKKIEKQNVNAANEARMRSKANAQTILKDLIKAHESDESTNLMQKLHFPCSMTPLKDAFDQILSIDTVIKINRDIASANFSNHSCDSYLVPKDLVNSLQSIGVDVTVKKSTFPKSFACLKFEATRKANFKRRVYEIDPDAMSEDEWRSDLKKQNKLEKKAQATWKKEDHEAQLEQILRSRLELRSLIHKKRSERKARAKSATSLNFEEDDPQVFEESNIFDGDDDVESDEDVDADDIVPENRNSYLDYELEQLFKAHASECSETTFVVPDFNMWQVKIIKNCCQHWMLIKVFSIPQKIFSITEHEANGAPHEMLISQLPKPFRWLLNHAASILHQHPASIYNELLCIEHQFTTLYQPIELMENVMLKRNRENDPLRKLNPYVSKCYRKFEMSW